MPIDRVGPQSTTGRGTIVQLDLRGVRCPLSWAKAKVRLETMIRGDELALLVDDPKGARDIPRAAETAGYVVTEIRDDHNGVWVLRILV